ncbi:type IV pilus modification protein PilV [Aquirhabdus sp.]|uniref:type IV pilus modification protein PilV n=1 Tax=Aquirhabdus sp. TaxID=2824160 RepID=UPI00396C7D3F
MLINQLNPLPYQKGVGMVEVLVAILLLAIGVLGFSVLQVRAVEATGEGFNRSQAIIILRGLAESIRVNSNGQTSYPTAVANYTAMTSAPTSPTVRCTASSPCQPADLAKLDSFQAALAAYNIRMNINMLACPGVPASVANPRQCLFAAWGSTTPTLGANTTDCMTTAGAYAPQATCVMMEAY